MASAPDDDANLDTELMGRVAADEPGAFERLVDRMLPRLLGYLRRLGAGREEAEDLSQEVLLKIYRARRAYVAKARFATYLFHVARNCWIDFYRHRRVGPATVSTDAPRGAGDAEGDEAGGWGATLAGRSDDPARAADAGLLKAALDRAVAALSPDHREAFVLAHLGVLRYEELSEVLGVPVGTVKSRVHAATLQVRAALRAGGFEP
jgi:RNA polymerase sigma-70 factor (ECF subfamily)